MAIAPTTISHKPRGLVRIKAAFTTDASGDAAEKVIGTAWGRLVGVVYDAGTGGTALATGVDITVKDTDSGATIFSLTDAGTSDRYIRPTAVITTNAGVAVSASTSAASVDRDIYLAGRVSMVVAQGGNAKAGALTLLVDESLGGGL